MALHLVGPNEHDIRARIAVFGVGGAGGNAVNNMIEKQLEGVDFVAANTDSQALANSRAPRSIQLGIGVTRGLGAGSKPEVGMRAAEETMEEIASHLEGVNMCFITAGMGGGTGTGAAPIVARIAREMGILTVGVVTKPFHFEGTRRMAVAEAGLEEMQQVVDTLIVIPNQNLFQVASERTTFVEAFQMADDVLYQGVQGVTDLMVRPGMINLDFADVRSVMEEMGKAMMGTGEAEGETRAIDAAEKAIANPLLDEVSLKGARGVLINITGGYDLTLFEMDEAANRIKEEVDPNAMIKFGSAIDPTLDGRMRVSVVATGIDADALRARPPSDSTMRRRPAETDPEIVTAVRGRRAEAGVVATAAAEPEEEIETEAEPVVAEAEPEVETETMPEFEAEAEPETMPEPEPVHAVAPEARYATAPSPADIRARADEVRRRAVAARVERNIHRASGTRTDEDEPALFDIDDRSLEHGDEPRSLPPHRESYTAQPSKPSRSGFFTINKLIHRVAGGHASDEAARTAERRDPEIAHDDDAGEIPAFLRRQAN